MKDEAKSQGNGLAEFVRCLRDLSLLRTLPDTAQETSPGTSSMIFDLALHVAGWKIHTADLFENDTFVVQRWTDESSGNVVVVSMKKSSKGCMPVLYAPAESREREEEIISTVRQDLFAVKAAA